MFKYAKYEIKGTYKYILGVLALVLILTTVLYAYVSQRGGILTSGGIFAGLLMLIIFGTVLATFLYIVGSFRKELYEDRGYLTFTLPLTGNQIVGSKLIVAFTWFTILGIAIVVYNIAMAMTFIPELNLSDLFNSIADFISIRSIIYMILSAIFSLVAMLVLIYFSMALSRVTFRNKKIGGIWFIIFIVLSALLAYGEFKIAEFLPYYIDMNTFSIGSMDTLNAEIHAEINNGMIMSVDTSMLITNIAAGIYNILTTVLLFLGTGYLIEKKTDL